MEINEIKQKVAENQERYISFLEKLIAFDTSVIRHGEDGQEGPAQQWLAEYLESKGFSVDLFEPDNVRMAKHPGFNSGHSYKGRPCLVAIYKGSGGGRSLILNGHMDTMPSGDTDIWDTNPWQLTRKGGNLFGLGTDDMKGGLAALVLACELLLENGFIPKGDIIIESVVDEEGGGNGTLACADRGYKADGAIIAEGSLLEVFAANRGAWLAQTRVAGQPIHASLRGFGHNAIEKTVKIINALRELETKWMTTRRHPLLAPPTINIGYIEGGVAASTVAESCTMRFDVEYYPSELDRFGIRSTVDKEDIKAEVESWLNQMAHGDEWLKDHPIQYEWYQDCAPFETNTEHPLVQELADSCAAVTGKRVISGMSAGCDARHLTGVLGIPTVVCGPGTCHNAHVVNEFLALGQYLDAIAVYADMIRKWTGCTA